MCLNMESQPIRQKPLGMAGEITSTVTCPQLLVMANMVRKLFQCKPHRSRVAIVCNAMIPVARCTSIYSTGI